jgi:putative addiction module component (TIGR02574 family)
MSTEELLAHVLRLPRHERAQVAEELLSSLEESSEDEVAVAWAEELDRRSREMAEGKVQPIEWKAARAELLEELGQRRASRAAS